MLLACIGTLLLTACTSDSNLPDPTGKGLVRAINAIQGSPEVGFLIEARPLGGVRYSYSTAPAEYDDFSYTFHFEISYPDERGFTRVASETVKLEADGDHILMITGDINAPDVTVFNDVVRTFDAAETVFEARFLHASPTLGNLDVYLDPPGTAPGTNPPVATLAYGEIADAADFAEGSYVLTVTAANDTDIVHFMAEELSLLPQYAHVISIFDGTENNTAPAVVRSMTSVGNGLNFVDARHLPQRRFIHGALTLETSVQMPVDIYDDELLTNRVVAGLDFKDTTGYSEIAAESTTYYVTPANSTATTLFDQAVAAPIPGAYSHIYLIGDTDTWAGVHFTVDRAPVATSARIRIFNSALNYLAFDVYAVERDVPLADDDIPVLINAPYPAVAPTISLGAGDFDLYITPPAEKTVLAGPYQVDATLGTSIELLVVDTVDPLFVEILDITTPP